MLDDLPSMMAPIRNRRGSGILCSLGSISNINTSSSTRGCSLKSTFSSRTKAITTPRSSSKDKDKGICEPLADSLVSKIVPQEFFFANSVVRNNDVNKREGRNEYVNLLYISYQTWSCSSYSQRMSMEI